MAFTESQRSKIRGYLGYSDTYLDDQTHFSSLLDTVGAKAETKVEIEGLLTSLATVESELSSSYTVAGITGAGQGDVEFSAGGKQRELALLGRRLCNQLAIKIGCKVQRDYFSSGLAVPMGLTAGFL